MTSEDWLSKYQRVQAMIINDNGTWDLSPNDTAALKHVLGMVNVMCDELASLHGTAVASEFKRIGKYVERMQLPPTTKG